ncbi:hypothetical protein [Neobacillus muris]|uniref:hypothetical protein n=1 Tax=Neobacillus muris TaxID=2941334 RepID=UPI00203D77E4|nr:hypothetical protein [Neobacillus muris]
MRSMRRMPFLKMFMPKQKRRGTLWASLLGVGISAAVFGLSRGKRQNLTLPIQNAFKNTAPAKSNQNQANHQQQQNSGKMGNLIKNMAPNFNLNRMDNAAITEFSEELMESALNKK